LPGQGVPISPIPADGNSFGGAAGIQKGRGKKKKKKKKRVVQEVLSPRLPSTQGGGKRGMERVFLFSLCTSLSLHPPSSKEVGEEKEKKKGGGGREKGNSALLP